MVDAVCTGCPIWVVWISKLYHEDVFYMREISKVPFFMKHTYSLFGTFHILRYPIELQGMFFWQKNKYFQKMPSLFCISKKPNWVLLNGADGWDLRTQWNILSKHQQIITKCLIVFSNLSCQYHSAGTQFGFFEIQNKEGIFWKYLFFCQKNIPWSTMGWRKILRVPKSLLSSSSIFQML